MPGPYAHITLLYELMQPIKLKLIFGASSEMMATLTTFFPYCVIGAVSPDYPNLAAGNTEASQWSDAMHLTRASEMIASGIRRVRCSKGAVRDMQLAWLLGYCAHLATDMTIHPVVQAKVGDYAENQRQHRICEMNQDSYIYRRMNLGEIGESDFFAASVAQCSDSENRTRLDSDIVTLWEGMLEDVYPELFIAQAPDCASWHQGFVDRVSEYTKKKIRLFPLAGVIASKMELPYPAYDLIDKQFIEDQLVPSKDPLLLHYDEIFDHAAGTVAMLWKQVKQAIYADKLSAPPTFCDWNLDNGRNEHGNLVFW